MFKITNSFCFVILSFFGNAAFSGSWWDSRTNAAITISSLQVTSGWTQTLLQGTFNTFTCIYSNDTHWVFRSDNVVQYLFSNDYYAVYCLEYTKITDNSYYYYLNFGKEPQLNNARVFLTSVDDMATYTSISDYCFTTNGPDAREYDVLVKQNTQSTVHVGQYLPDPLLGVFDYRVTDSTSTTCDSVSSVWDGCYVGGNIDRTTITLNYTLCGTTVMGSTGGVFYKVTHVFHSDTYYVTLINSAGTDTIFTCILIKASAYGCSISSMMLSEVCSNQLYPTSCMKRRCLLAKRRHMETVYKPYMAVTQSGNTRSISTNPGGCAEGQVATSRTSDANSQLISLTAYETCLIQTTTTSTTRQTTNVSSNNSGSNSISSSLTTAAIVGVVISLLLIVVLAIILAVVVFSFLMLAATIVIVSKKILKSTKVQSTHQASLSYSVDQEEPSHPDSDFTFSDQQRGMRNLATFVGSKGNLPPLELQLKLQTNAILAATTPLPAIHKSQ